VLSIVKLSDVNGSPAVKLELVGPLRIGDLVALRFNLGRRTGGRSEILHIDGKFRVTAIGFDASSQPQKQLLSVDSVGTAPTWRSVKKPVPVSRGLGPTRFPRTTLS
jgi:hypothetical protein